MDHPAPRGALGHIRALDGIRAIAIVAVIGLHAIARLFPAGALGVDVFFGLSAFLITALLIREHDRTGTVNFRAFYWRRAFRLLPALLLWLVLLAAPTAVLLHETGTIASSSLAAVFYFADLSQRFGIHLGSPYAHAWSLSVEEQFYFVWPAILLFVLLKLRPRAQRMWLVGSIVGAEVVLVAGQKIASDNYFLPTGHMVPLMFGALAADLWLRGAPAQIERFVKTSAVGVLALGAFGVMVATATTRPWSATITAVLTATIILNVIFQPSAPAARLLGSRVAQWIGQRSYGLYLYHRTLTGLIPALWPGITLKVAGPVGILAAAALAEASYRLIETPIRRRGRRWLSSRRPAVESVAVPVPQGARA